jgi:predicted adenylyl cyclase CyaB
VEIKARLNDPDGAERVARRLSGSAAPEVLEQVDTYFAVPAGRLKLREMEGRAELIYYRRGDSTGPSPSDYLIAPITSAEALKEVLGACLGIGAVVRKIRRLYIWNSVRIHLDMVEGLGSFIEFEAVLSEGDPAEHGYRAVRRLMTEFAIDEEDLIAGSYSDLVDWNGGQAAFKSLL